MSALTIYECPKCELRAWLDGHCPNHAHPTIPAPRLLPVRVLREEDVRPLWEKCAGLAAAARGFSTEAAYTVPLVVEEDFIDALDDAERALAAFPEDWR